MSITTIPKTENKWLIFFGDDDLPTNYFDCALDQQTQFENDYWIFEEYATKALWLGRLLEFGIIPVYPPVPPPPPPAPDPLPPTPPPPATAPTELNESDENI